MASRHHYQRSNPHLQTRMPSDSSTTSQIAMAPLDPRWPSHPYMSAALDTSSSPHTPPHPYRPSNTSSGPYQGDHWYPPTLRSTFGMQSFGNHTPQFQPSAISNVGSMRVGSMAVNMNVENVMKSEDNGGPRSVLELLRDNCAPTALVDSRERFDPPRCAETTRRAIIQEITDWANNDENEEMRAELFWLRGGAGAGKSALAQTLSESFKLDGKLGASFFFSRGTLSRSDCDKLIPTIILQLIGAFPDLSAFVEDKLHQNAILFSKTRQTLALELFFEPLLRLSLQDDFRQNHPRLIVIDGLDECADPDVQCDLLNIIAGLIRHLPYPLRFFITSRPESHIVRSFDYDPDLQSIKVLRYDLSTDCDATEDIRKFLRQEFRTIHEVHPLRHHMPPNWANKDDIDILVQRSSGHFIYASTVIRYIKSPRHRPHDRLKIIVELLPPPRKDQPYAQLDALYAIIFSGVDKDDLETIHCVFGLLHLHNQPSGVLKEWVGKSNHEMMEVFLNLQSGDIILLFDPLLSLVAIDDKDIRVLHKSLIDYLLDPIRSTCFHLDLALAHEAVANYLLINHLLEQRCDFNALEYFVFHCHFARLNERLKRYLIDLNILYDKFIPKITQVFEFSNDHVMQLLPILKALRPLRREGFNVHTHHITRLFNIFIGMSCPRLANCTALEVKDGFLSSMLRDWLPYGFVPPNGGVPQTSCYTKQEWSVLSKFIELQLPSTPRFTWRTGVIRGQYFTHHYFYGSSDSRFFALVTYAKDTDKFVLSSVQTHMKGVIRSVIISRTKGHLALAGRVFGSTAPVTVEPADPNLQCDIDGVLLDAGQIIPDVWSETPDKCLPSTGFSFVRSCEGER